MTTYELEQRQKQMDLPFEKYQIVEGGKLPYFPHWFKTNKFCDAELVKGFIEKSHRPSGWNNTFYEVVKPFALKIECNEDEFTKSSQAATNHNPIGGHQELYFCHVVKDGVVYVIFDIGIRLLLP